MKLKAITAGGLILCLTSLARGADDVQAKAEQNLKLNREMRRQAVHQVVREELVVGEKQYVHFILDRLPGLERVELEMDGIYLRAPGKPWLKSADWEYSGAPVSEEKAKSFDLPLALADLPFVEPKPKDTTQGAHVWKLLEEKEHNGEILTQYEHTRERPRPGGEYPRYTYAANKEGALPTLRFFTGQAFDQSGKLMPVWLENFFLSPEHSQARRRKELTREVQMLKARMALEPIHVDGTFTAVRPLKVKGLVHGVNSDLTYTREDGSSERIVVHDGLCWTSEDNGKSWKEQESPDRSYARIMFSALLYNGSESMGEGIFMEDLGRRDNGNGVEQHARLGEVDEKQAVNASELWIYRGTDREPMIQRVKSPVWMMNRINQLDARYEHQPNATVRPPPGVKLALQTLVGDARPEQLLYKAKQAMKDKPRWKVIAHIDDGDLDITGFIEGDRSDLTVVTKESTRLHEIIINDVRYLSVDGDKTWAKQEMDRDFHLMVSVPMRFREDEKIPPFEFVEQKVREDGSVEAHVRLRSPEAVNADNDRNNWWMEVGPDKSLRLKRYSGPLVFEGKYVYGSVAYEEAGKDEGMVKAPK